MTKKRKQLLVLLSAGAAIVWLLWRKRQNDREVAALAAEQLRNAPLRF